MSKILVGSKEWLEARRYLVTASDVPTILGQNPYDTPEALMERKLSGVEKKKTKAMLRGEKLEEEARKLFENITGEVVWPEFKVSEYYPWLAASFDGINKDCIVEIKCPSSRKVHEIAVGGEIPWYYKGQVLTQMIVEQRQEAYFMSYFPKIEKEWEILKLQTDLWGSQVKEILDKTREFHRILTLRMCENEMDKR